MISTLNDLQKLLRILRKQGVQEFKMGDIQLKLGDLPFERVNADPEPESDQPEWKDFPTGMLTEAQAIHYASGGTPENDPELVGR